MKRIRSTIYCWGITLILLAIGAPPAWSDVYIKPMDKTALLRRDAGMNKEQAKYAVPYEVVDHYLVGGDITGGKWEPAADGMVQWEVLVEASGASSIDIGFSRFWLPHGAELLVMSPDGDEIWKRYDDRDSYRSQLWTPVFRGDTILVRLVVPEELRDYVELTLAQVNYGYRFFNQLPVKKSASCNVDVICPEGGEVRDQIRGVAVITNGGSGGFCSGSLINNSRGDNTPYFLTAEHCSVNGTTANFYFNYESDTCRSGSASGTALPLFGDVITGAEIVAENPQSDFTLLRLSETPPPEYDVHYSGWDRRDVAASMVTGIHHPAGDEKRLAIEFDPVVDSPIPVSFGRPSFAGNTYWEVLEWDIGITEQGSSGSPLLNAQNRIIGQLGGGALFNCPGAEEGSDIYGKLSASFDLGTTPESSLEPWLDPDLTGVEIVDGKDGCIPPDVTVSGPTVPVAAGDDVVLGAVASGIAPFTFAWDLDGDGVSDVETQDVVTRFPSAGNRSVRLTVTDAEGCPANAGVGIAVDAPSVSVSGVRGQEQVCGDDDQLVEPGETWRYTMELQNSGGLDFGSGIAAFASSSISALRQDAFGYTVGSSLESAICGFSPVSLTDSAIVLETVDFSGAGNSDDGGAVVSLGGNGFTLYGSSTNSVVVSTNGYLGLDAQLDSGSDFDNQCPYPDAPNQGGGARIAAFHDDLIINGTIRHEYFEVCPRPSESGVPEQGCNVFEWENASFFNDPSRIFSFQTILYEDTLQIVNQYLRGDNLAGAAATIAIQNADASIGLTSSCNQPVVQTLSSVCFFHPDAPAQSSATDSIVIASPAVRLAPIPANDGVGIADVDVHFPSSISCDSSFSVDYLGAATPSAYSPGEGAVLSATIGGPGCAVVASDCNASFDNSSSPDGFWTNVSRPGNGVALHSSESAYGTWYTGEENRQPIWYYLQSSPGSMATANQVRTNVLRFQGPVGNSDTPPTSQPLGTAVFSFADSTEALMTWELDGQEFGELIRFLDVDGSGARSSDQWFNPAEPGWGLAVQRQTTADYAAAYFFDETNAPVWATVLNPQALAAGQLALMGIYDAHCPGCPWVAPELEVAGAMIFRYLDDENARLDFSIISPPPSPIINWRRFSYPVQAVEASLNP